MASVQKSISAICPQWEAFEQTLLTHGALVQEFKDMKPLHSNNIGPLCNILKEWLKLIKQVKGSPLVAAHLIKPATDVQVMGKKTVVLRVVICCLEIEWPQLQSPAEVTAAVDKLREIVSAKNVLLPVQSSMPLSCGQMEKV